MEGWGGAQRQGQDMADRLGSIAHGLGCMWQTHLRSHCESNGQQPAGGHRALPSPSSLSDARCPDQENSAWHFSWHGAHDRSPLAGSPSQGSLVLRELAQRLEQAGATIGACVGSFATHFSAQFASAFQESSAAIARDLRGDHLQERGSPSALSISATNGKLTTWKCASDAEQRKNQDRRLPQEDNTCRDFSSEELFALFSKRQGALHRQGSINVTTSYDSRTQQVESSVTARGDLWRAEASHGGGSPNNRSSPLYLLQIGPILFVRESTLLLPIHLSKQHLLWYGFDRKNGVHSICPAVWSKHRRWLLMSMMHLSPVTCSFVDLQFPNGQFTYVAGEGITGSVFYPLLGGLLQARAHPPGTTQLSFSKKMSWGTRLTPSFQLTEKSFSLDIVQPVAWQRSAGIIVRPTVQLRVAPTFGGRNSGWRAEVAHFPKEKINWACGCIFTIQPSAYTSISLGKSKNGNGAGNSTILMVLEAPLETPCRASFRIQLNSGVEF